MIHIAAAIAILNFERHGGGLLWFVDGNAVVGLERLSMRVADRMTPDAALELASKYQWDYARLMTAVEVAPSTEVVPCGSSS